MTPKTQITAEDVKRIAQLARLGLTDEEIAKATADLQGVLDHFSAIQAIDTTDIPTADDSSGLTNIAREDSAKPEELAKHQQLLEMAPETQNDQVKVKAVFK